MSAEGARETERTMLDRLHRRYSAVQGNGVRYIRAEHVKLMAGFDGYVDGVWTSQRIADFLAMDLWGGRLGPQLHGHEVKVSRSDLQTELRDPDKAEAFARYCDFWWLVVPDASIVKGIEIPEAWGILVTSGASLRAHRGAERREPLPMTRHLQATLMRATVKTTLRTFHLIPEDRPTKRHLYDLSLPGGAFR